jgi:hypothetical protein
LAAGLAAFAGAFLATGFLEAAGFVLFFGVGFFFTAIT